MKIEIRKTKISDAEQYIRLTNMVYRAAYSNIMPQEVFDGREAEFAKRLKSFGVFGLNENGNVNYVALDGDNIIGILQGSGISNYLHYNQLGYADLTAIYIHPDYQRKGLGKKLFDIIAAEFAKQGCKKMAIGVLKDNFKARNAYEKWGCVLDTAYEKSYVKFGLSFPEVFYIYDLSK